MIADSCLRQDVVFEGLSCDGWDGNEFEAMAGCSRWAAPLSTRTRRHRRRASPRMCEAVRNAFGARVLEYAGASSAGEALLMALRGAARVCRGERGARTRATL